MWPSDNVYKYMISNANYKAFEESDKHSKKYIDISVGFYGGCSYHPTGWDATFASIRKNFPTEPIVLFEDGQPEGHDYSEMAKKFNATYIKENVSIYLTWLTPEQAWTYLQWILKAADITKTEWLIQLHPDVICNDRISVYPPGPLCGVGAGSRNGVSNNQFFVQKANDVLKVLHPELPHNGYGWCGGGCIHVPTFRKIMETFTFLHLKLIHATLYNDNDKIHNIILHDDIFLPFLFNIYGYPYRVWLEIEEVNRWQGFGSSAAFQHGNKNYYSRNAKSGSEFMKDIISEKIGNS